MDVDYSQPFCIVGSVGKFHPSYRFYLPALELPKDKPLERESWKSKQWYTVQQLLSEIRQLRGQWYQHLREDREWRASKEKPPSKYQYTTITKEKHNG